MSGLQLVPTPARKLAESEALERLQGMRPEDIVETRLAGSWGWSRMKLRWAIQRWRAEGLLKPKPGSKPKVQAKAPKGKKHTRVVRAPMEAAPPAVPLPAPPEVVAPPPQSPEPVAWRRRLLALAIAGTAFALGGVGLILNFRFALSLASSSTPGDALALLGVSSGALLAAIAIVFDLLTILLPAAADALWEIKRRSAWAWTWGVYAVCLSMTLIAAGSFVTTNVGDSRLGRENVTEERASLEVRLADLAARRAAIHETRSVGVIEAALLAAQQVPAVVVIWRQTRECLDVTLPTSATACRPVTDLRQAKAAAEARDSLDAARAATEAAKNELPAIAAVDPGAEWLAAVLRNALRLPATADLIGNIRMAGLALAPPMAGLLLKFALVLWGGATRREKNG